MQASPASTSRQAGSQSYAGPAPPGVGSLELVTSACCTLGPLRRFASVAIKVFFFFNKDDVSFYEGIRASNTGSGK